MPVLLRYVSGPTLAIIFSFAYPEFYTLRYDPLMIVGFTLAHLLLLLILIGFVMPRYYDVFIPPSRQGEGMETTVAGQTKIDVPEVEAGAEGSIDDADMAGSEPSHEMKRRSWPKLWRSESKSS